MQSNPYLSTHAFYLLETLSWLDWKVCYYEIFSFHGEQMDHDLIAS